MAEDRNEKDVLEQLEKEITCSLCHEHYSNPKVLLCLHYFCQQCVLKLSHSTTDNSQVISCPECQLQQTLPQGGAGQLKTVPFIRQLQSNFTFLQKVYGKLDVACEECMDSDHAVDSFCQQCAVFICRECLRQHKRMKTFSNHEIVFLKDLRLEHARELLPVVNCGVHEEPLIAFCFDCNHLVCRDCTITVHRDHQFEFNKIAAPNARKKLLENLLPLRDATHTLLGATSNIQRTQQSVRDQGTAVARELCSSFNQLQVILEERKQELLRESEGLVKEKLNKLDRQENELSRCCVEVESLVGHYQRFISDCSDNEVMEFHTEILSRVQQEAETLSKSVHGTKLMEEPDVGVEVNCTEDLQQLCSTKACVTQLTVSLSECHVRGAGKEAAEVLLPTEVVLSTKSTSKKPTNRTSVIATLRSLWDEESVIKCIVEPLGHGEYRIQYTPLVRGRHELTVMVDGQQVAGSPFPVLVSISPTQLGKPVKTWAGSGMPESIAATSQGDEVIVAVRTSGITKISKDGKIQVLVENSRIALNSLRAVAVDGEDNIYCTDEDTGKVFCCDSEGGSIRVYSVQQIKGPGHRGLALVGDEVLLCERNSAGSIVIYDKELKYRRVIYHEDVGELINVSSDSQGKLYATDFSNSMIRVFSRDGSLLHSFGCDAYGEKRLERPFDVCVSSQYVYVTNYSGHCVSAFTRDGQYVASFGKGDLKFPRGVVVDRRNFVIVTNASPCKIQCF